MMTRRPRTRVGLKVPRVFARAGEDPFDSVEWSRRTARIEDGEGRVLFEQRGVEAPTSFSDRAVDLIASRYFAGRLGTRGRESSVRALVARVATTIAGWVPANGDVFHDELAWLLLHQHAAFNSPVWFNVGIEARPQCSACFILGVEDHLASILEVATVEGRVFSRGSGAGSNFSALRASTEPTRTGGLAAGPVAFLRGLDALAGAVKSGGRTRRAAKMAILDVDHPDVRAFIESKATEETRARALAAAGLGTEVAFQNENHSVRMTDAFLRAALRDGTHRLVPRTGAVRPERVRARDVLRAAARAAHACGDPGVLFSDTVNRWNPVPRTGPIRATNPCAEFVFLDDTACNLASLNVLAFREPKTGVDVERLRAAVRVLVLAMEALVEHASYPTPRIAQRSAALRPLGLGVSNLGALLLSLGLPYDSEAGRGLAAGVVALVGGEATRVSAELAERLGPYTEWRRNRVSALAVLGRHVRAASRLPRRGVPAALRAAAVDAWGDAARRASRRGLRHAQVTAIAPTGTISFLMDCDTTGIEPALALAHEKTLTEGGVLRLSLRVLPAALAALGYANDSAAAILSHVDATGGIVGAPGFRSEHAAVFATALASGPGGERLSPEAHLAMMAALQPFVSGGISKTVNLPADATVDDVEAVFVKAWRLGLKAVAIYRDKSKVTQPLSARSSSALPSLPPVCAAASGCD